MSSIGEMPGSVVDASAAPAATVARAGALEALPTIRIVTDGSDDPDVVRVAALFRTAFASFDTIEMIGGEYSGREPRLSTSPGGFVLSVASGADEGSVLLELQCLGSGRVLVNRTLSALQTNSGALENEVASLVTAVAPVNGVIYGYLKQNGLQSELVNCLILNDAYYLEWTQPSHLAAYRCFEKLMAAHARSPLVYAALASLRTSAKTDQYRLSAQSLR